MADSLLGTPHNLYSQAALMQVRKRRNLVSGILKVALVLLGLTAFGLSVDDLLSFPTVRNIESVAVGVTLIAAGVSLETWGTCALWQQGLGTPNPAEPPSRLVTTVPYRFSRNPLYLARFCMLLGGSLFLGSMGTVLVSIALFIGLNFLLLPREEGRLQGRFGNNYLDYKAEVSRWITLTPSRRVRRKLDQ